MTADEFAAYRKVLPHEYAATHVEAGNWLPEEAAAKAEAELASALGGGLDQPDTLLLTAVMGDETPVGLVWVSLTHPRGVPGAASIFDIQIFPEHRGNGLGRELLEAVEEEVARRGHSQMALNVFGSNRAALALYSSAGYEVITQQMRKELGSRAATDQ
jgi:ribosomal protein S18 acetylase RimI-like enzyme